MLEKEIAVVAAAGKGEGKEFLHRALVDAEIVPERQHSCVPPDPEGEKGLLLKRL
jgi:hypothetical protein